MIEPEQPGLPIARQCELLALSRSTFYYTPVGESPVNLALMRLIDEAFTECPFYGAHQMVRHLGRQGHAVGRNRVVQADGQDGVVGDLPEAEDHRTAPGT